MKKIFFSSLIIICVVVVVIYVSKKTDLQEFAPVKIQPAETFLHLQPAATLQERAEVFLQKDYSTPAAIVYEWLPYYYRHPAPNSITEVFGTIVANGRVIDDSPDIKGGFSRFSRFKTKVSATAHQLQKFSPDIIKPLLRQNQQIVLFVRETPSFIHFFGTLLSGQPEELHEFEAAAAGYSEPWKTIARQVIAKAGSYTPAELTTADDVALVWAEYMATGEIELVKKVIGGNFFGESRIHNPDFINTIEAGLFNYSRMHVDVYDLVAEASREAKGLRQKRLEKIYKVIDNYVSELSNIHLRRGINHTNMKQHGQAHTEYHKALGYFPDYANVYVNMATTFEYQGDMNKAYAAGQKAYQIQPLNASVCYGVARHLYMQRKYDQALQMYLKAAEINPRHHLYIYAIGDIYKYLGEKDKAINYFHQYLKKSPHGMYTDDIRRYLLSVNAPFADDPDDLITLLKNGGYEALESQFSRLLQEKEKDADGYSLLRNAYEYLSSYIDNKYSYDEWVKYFSGWLENSPDSHFANAAAGIFYIDYAWHARGTGWSQTVVKEGRETFRKRLELASEYLEKAYSLDPSDPIVPASLIKVAMALSQGDEVMEEQFQRAVNADPNEYRGYHAKLVYLMPKWHGSAEKIFNFARQAGNTAPPNSLIPWLLSDAHWEAYYRSDDRESYFKQPEVWRELKPLYIRMCEQFPESLAKRNRFARTAYLAGDYQTAKEQFLIIEEKWDESVWGNYKYFSRIKNEVLKKTKEEV